VIVIGRRDTACKRAEQLGHADVSLNNTKVQVPDEVKALLGGGADLGIEAIGHEAIIADLLACLKPEGQCAIYGVSPTTEAQSTYRDDPRVITIGAHEEDVHDEVFGWIRDGKVVPSDFISQVLSFDEVPRGYDLLEKREAFKIAFLP
jgi:alcohol dehydrogenase